MRADVVLGNKCPDYELTDRRPFGDGRLYYGGYDCNFYPSAASSLRPCHSLLTRGARRVRTEGYHSASCTVS